MSQQLITSLNQCLANSFELYSRAHGFHWNIEGIQFPLYHDFFGDIYTEIYSAIDPLAEEIRAAGGYAIFGTSAFSKTNMLPDSKNQTGTDVKSMLNELDMCNEIVLKCLNASFKIAESEDAQGLMDFLAGRIDAHKKHSWMIKSCLKG